MASEPDEVMWPMGSREHRRGGLPERLYDPGGVLAWACSFRDGELTEARFRVPAGGEVFLRASEQRHPVLGEVFEVGGEGGAMARFSRVSFRAPASIPAMDRPGALPAGAGTAILGFLAARARSASGGPLRYRGPYPTASLFDALMDCFSVRGDAREALARFVSDAERRAFSARMDEVPVDFEPAPFERRWPGGGVCVQLRDGVEKVFIAGRSFSRDQSGPRRLRSREGRISALVEIAGAPYCEVASLTEGGELVSGPRPLPPVDSPLVGRSMPSAVGRALAAALPGRAPVALRDPLREVVLTTPLVWGDPGPDEATVRGGAIVFHPALADRLGGNDLLEAIARAAELPAQKLAQAALASRLTSGERGETGD